MYVSLYNAGFKPDDEPLGTYLISNMMSEDDMISLLDGFSDIYGYRILFLRPNGVIQTYNQLKLLVVVALLGLIDDPVNGDNIDWDSEDNYYVIINDNITYVANDNLFKQSEMNAYLEDLSNDTRDPENHIQYEYVIEKQRPDVGRIHSYNELRLFLGEQMLGFKDEVSLYEQLSGAGANREIDWV